jgi:hypothetical protein
MAGNRLFVSQAVLDQWLGEQRVEVHGEELTLLPEKHRFSLKTAVYFKGEVTGAGDGLGLVGRVKDLDQITALGGDYSAGSVIVGDLAYDVEEGLAGTPLTPPATDLASALMTPGSGAERPAELDALAKLFLERR